MIIESIEQLADSSVFDYYSIEIISELELHLRTLVSLIELMNKALIGFQIKIEDFHPLLKLTTLSDLAISNEGNVYKDVKQVWRRTKGFLRKILGITPGLIKTGISHGTLIDSGIELLFKNLQETFTWKYPISSWYYEWRTLLELNFNIQKFSSRGLLPPNYSERMEPHAFPHSLWFGALDIAQELITKIQSESICICYYLALESLQKAPSSFIRFKAKESLDSVKRLKSHQMNEAIREKSFYDEKLVATNKSNDNNQNTFNEDSENISKLKSQQKFRTSDSIRKKFLRHLNFFTALNALTEILEEYPTSHSLQCYRAKVYIECNNFMRYLKI
ncbi:17425_t:CDS:2 [Gigaspora margarita]|uniref:17425_t:CDS:1 n=1 Tax=Gigaspora margarita TaxID=4874 RepID=A0ABM8VY69_GIGMA|nr:17425_t:CDS:2 [Gigaspora margarita]